MKTIYTLATVICLILLCTGTAGAGFVNGGFESGDLTGWNRVGAVIVTSEGAFGSPAPNGTYYGLLQTDTFRMPGILVQDLETFAGLTTGTGDPADAGARIAGVRKVVDLCRPLTLKADKALSAKLDGDLQAVEANLGQPGAPPDAASADKLKGGLADLGADLTDLQAALGLNAT